MDSVSHLINAAMEFGSALMAVMNKIAVSFWLYIRVQTIKLARSTIPIPGFTLQLLSIPELHE